MKKAIILLITFMLIGTVFLSGCAEDNEAKAIRIGKEYLKDRYSALEDDYLEILFESCYDNGSYYRVSLECRDYSDISQTIMYSCKVDKETWKAYDASVT